MQTKILALILLLTPSAVFAKRKPVPAQLANAKTVRLTCNGQPCEEPILSAARKTLAKWGRYSLILDGSKADLILSFDIGSPHEGMAHYEVLSPAGTGSVSDIATQDAPRVQEIKKHWIFSVLDGDEAAHPKLWQVQDVYSDDDGAAAQDLIYKLKREVGKRRP
jgi:hypothetical protein